MEFTLKFFAVIIIVVISIAIGAVLQDDKIKKDAMKEFAMKEFAPSSYQWNFAEFPPGPYQHCQINTAKFLDTLSSETEYHVVGVHNGVIVFYRLKK